MARFGKDTPGPDGFPTSDNRAVLSKFVLTEAATLTSLHVYFNSGSGANLKGLIYADNAGTPGALVAVGAPSASSPTLPGWVASAFAGEEIPAGTYWIGIVTSGLYAQISMVSSGGDGAVFQSSHSYASPPDPWPGNQGALATSAGSIYVEYEPAASETAKGSASLTFAAAGHASGTGPLFAAGTASLAFGGSAAPAQNYFGNMLGGVGGSWPMSEGRVVTSRFELTERAQLQTFTQDFEVATSGVTWRGLVLTDVAGEPGEVVAASDVAAGDGSSGYKSAPISGVLEPGWYWLATQGEDFRLRLYSTVVAEGGLAGNLRMGEGAPTPFMGVGDDWPTTVGGARDGTLNVYVTYVPAPEEGAASGSAGLALAVSATLRATVRASGSTGLSLSAAAEARTTLHAAGAAGLALAATGAARATAAAAGSAGMAMAATGALRGAGAAAGSAGMALATSGAARGVAAAAGSAGLTLAATGAARGGSGARGSAGLTLATSGAARGVAAASGTAGAVLATSGTARGTAAASGAASLTLGATAAPRARLHARGSTGMALAAYARTLPPTAAGAVALALAATATARATVRAAGTAGLALSPTGTPRGEGALVGRAGVSFSAAGAARGRGAASGSAHLTLATTATTVPPNARGRAAVGLGAAASPTPRVRARGAAQLVLGAGARGGGRAAAAGSAGLSFDASARTDRVLRANGRAALAMAAVGALLARLAGRGAAEVVFTGRGAIAGSARARGAAAFELRARVRPPPLSVCPPIVVVLEDPPVVVVTLADDPPIPVPYAPQDAGPVVLEDDAVTRVVLSC